MYFTIVGNPPIAFFFNSKEMNSYQWIVALMESFSQRLKEGVPITKLIDETKETFDPNGSYIIPDGTNRRANSIVHHIGLILEDFKKEMK